jgi:hypothetical protein
MVKVNSEGSGTVTNVVAGNGLSGGGTVTATLNLDFSELTDMTSDISGTTEFILQNGTTESRKAASEIKLTAFDATGFSIAGAVDTSGTPIAQEYARFTDANTIEGRSAAGVRTDLGLVIGTNVQAQNDYLQDIADLNPTITEDGKVLSWNEGNEEYELIEQSGGVSFNGSTANGLLTYGNSATADVETGLTYDGSTLGVTGEIDVSDIIHANGVANNRLTLADGSDSSQANQVTLAGGNNVNILIDNTNNGTGDFQVRARPTTANDLDTASMILDMDKVTAVFNQETSQQFQIGGANRLKILETGTFIQNSSLGVGVTPLDGNARIQAASHIEAGVGSGAIGLTINDGGGNSNVTFNHTGRVPEQNGNSGRIEVNTDGVGGQYMAFELAGNVTSGVSVATTEIARINSTGLQSSLSGTAASPALRVNDSDTGLYRIADNKLGISTAGTFAVAVDASQNVGIGTTSPAYTLDVDGNIRATGDLRASDDIILDVNANYLYARDASGTLTRMFGMNSSNTTYIGPIDSYAGGRMYYGTSSNMSGHNFYTGGTVRMKLDGYVLDLPNTGDWSFIKNNTNSGGLRFGTKDGSGNYANQIEISNAGNYVKLNENTTVTGNLTTTAHLVLPYGEINDAGTDLNIVGTNAVTLQSSAGTALTIPNASTNVGIGTVSPGTKLEVKANGTTSQEVIKIRNSSNTEMFSFGLDSGGDGYLNFNTSPGTINTNGGHLVLSPGGSGNVGIDDTSPSYPLDVNGDINTTGSYRMDDSTIIDTNRRIRNINSSVGADLTGGTHRVDFATPATPGSTGWYTICRADSANARGGGIITLSGTGGSITPQTITIDFFVEWQGHLVRCNVYGDGGNGGQFLKVRLIETALTTELQIYVNTTASQDVHMSFEQDRYNPNYSLLSTWATATPTVTGDEILIKSASFYANGSRTDALTVQDSARRLLLGRDSIKSTDLSGSTTQLFINSNTTFSGTITTGGQIAINDTNAILYRNSNDLEIKTYAGYDINLMPAGNVGIGDDNPPNKLSVKGSSTDLLYLEGDGITSNSIIQSATGGSTRIRSAGGKVEFYTGGANNSSSASGADFAMAINSNQRVGIGTSSPGRQLTVYGEGVIRLDSASADPGIDFNTAGTSDMQIRYRGASDKLQVYSYGTSTNLMTIQKSNGFVGIGTESPYEKLDVKSASSTSPAIVANGAAANGCINMAHGYAGQNGDYVNTYGTQYSSIATVIGFGVKPSTTANDTFLCSADNANFVRGALVIDDELRFWTAGAQTGTLNNNITMTERFRLTPSGVGHFDNDVVAYSSTVSDKRLKENITTIDNALDKVMALRGVEYDWTATSRKGTHDIGLVAQEVEEVIPELVTEHELCTGDFGGEGNEKTFKTVNYDKMVGVLIEAIKEQQQQINELKEKLNG